MASAQLVDDVIWHIFDYVTDDETIQNLSYCSKDYLEKVQAYFRGRYLATSRKCTACGKLVKLDEVNTKCDYHSGPSKSWMDFYDDPSEGWRFTGSSAFTCCGTSNAGCVHSSSHTLDKAKCKNCGAMFSVGNKKGKGVCRYHPGTATFSGNHSAAFSCCMNTYFRSPGCKVDDAHETETMPGTIDRVGSIFWSRSGRKCAMSSGVGTFVFQYNSSFNRWAHTHLLQSRPGTSVSNKAYGLLEHPLQEPFSPNRRYLLMEKSGAFRSSNHFVFDLADNKYIGPFCTSGSALGYTWTSDNKYVVMLMKYQEDHGPIALHTFDVQNGKALPVRTFTPSTSSFERKDLENAYFVPAAKEPSTVSCRHPDLKVFADRWVERDVYVFFEPYGDKFLMVSAWGNMSLYQFNVSIDGAVVKHLKYKSSFIPKGCSLPIRTVQWKKDGIIIFAERNPRGRAAETQFHFDIYHLNNNLDETHVSLDAKICPSSDGDVSLFRYDPDRNIYYYAQASVLRVLDAKTCAELWSMPLPKDLPSWHTELQFNIKNRILQHITNGIMLHIPETRPEQPVEVECFWTQFFNSAKCFVEK